MGAAFTDDSRGLHRYCTRFFARAAVLVSLFLSLSRDAWNLEKNLSGSIDSIKTHRSVIIACLQLDPFEYHRAVLCSILRFPTVASGKIIRRYKSSKSMTRTTT